MNTHKIVVSFRDTSTGQFLSIVCFFCVPSDISFRTLSEEFIKTWSFAIKEGMFHGKRGILEPLTKTMKLIDRKYGGNSYFLEPDAFLHIDITGKQI